MSFDAAKAERELLTGCHEVIQSLTRRQRALEEEHVRVEQELNDVKKIMGWVRGDMAKHRQRLEELEAASA